MRTLKEEVTTKLEELIESPKGRLCVRSEAISQFVPA